MNYNDDIDFLYFLENHGWSTCYIYIQGKIYYLGPTHVFNNPIETLLNGLIIILNGESKAKFSWYDEPGEYEWSIIRNPEQKHKMQISITECLEVTNSKKTKLEVIDFEVKIKLFCICVFKQMEKIRELLKEKSYREHRDGEFPHSTFEEFSKAFKNAYSY